MTALLLYGYAVGVFLIEKDRARDARRRGVSRACCRRAPALHDDQRLPSGAFANFFRQVLEVCMSAGLVKLGHAAIDGTKMKANASKHKAMSHERMVKHEARLKAEVEALLRKAEETDAGEDQLYGIGQQPQDVPAELQRRDTRRAKIREALGALSVRRLKHGQPSTSRLQ